MAWTDPIERLHDLETTVAVMKVRVENLEKDLKDSSVITENLKKSVDGLSSFQNQVIGVSSGLSAVIGLVASYFWPETKNFLSEIKEWI